MHPAGFMSKKFTNTQCTYFTYEHETLGVIEALKKWDDILLGLPDIWIITDHKALKTFMLKAHAGPRQIQWSQWLLQFCLKFIHVLGVQNCGADALSHIYENPNSIPQLNDLSTMDVLLDADGNNLTEERLCEKDIHHIAVMTQAQQVREATEPRDWEAAQMVPPSQEDTEERPTLRWPDDLTVVTSAATEPLRPFQWQREISNKQCPDLETLCRDGYTSDKVFRKILDNPDDHKLFNVADGLIYYSPNTEIRTLCIPCAEFQGRRVTELVIDQTHRIVGHMGPRITNHYA